MATRIKLKRSTTATVVPTLSNLEDGEVALNIADKKLYARNGSNIIEVANQKPNTGEVVTTMLSSNITLVKVKSEIFFCNVAITICTFISQILKCAPVNRVCPDWNSS